MSSRAATVSYGNMFLLVTLSDNSRPWLCGPNITVTLSPTGCAMFIALYNLQCGYILRLLASGRTVSLS